MPLTTGAASAIAPAALPLWIWLKSSPTAALQSATIRAAEVLGVDDQGVIEAGKRADIIALPADPLADIEAVRNVVFVMKDGVVYKQP